MDDGDDDKAPFRHKDDEEVTAELFCLFYHPRTYHAHFSLTQFCCASSSGTRSRQRWQVIDDRFEPSLWKAVSLETMTRYQLERLPG